MDTGYIATLWLSLALLVSVAAAFPRVSKRESRLGFTEWNCAYSRPSGWVRADLLARDMRAALEVAAHEAKHVEQMLRYKSCNQYKAAWWSNPDSVGFEMEAEAYCASARVNVEVTKTVNTMARAINRHALTLATEYPFGVSLDSARARITYYCRDHLGN